jgi:hypothetical protein
VLSIFTFGLILCLSACGIFNKKDDPQPNMPVVETPVDIFSKFHSTWNSEEENYQSTYLQLPDGNDSLIRVIAITNTDNGLGENLITIDDDFLNKIGQGISKDSAFPKPLPDPIFADLQNQFQNVMQTFLDDFSSENITRDSAQKKQIATSISQANPAMEAQFDAWIETNFKVGNPNQPRYELYIGSDPVILQQIAILQRGK